MTTNELNTIIFVETAKKEALPDAPLAAPRTEAPLAASICRSFTLSVMVYSPQSGYKFEVEIEKNCAANNEELWTLIFILSKKINNQFETLVTIKFEPTDKDQNKKVSNMADNGLTRTQMRGFRDQVVPPTKLLGDEARNPTKEEAKSINSSIKKIIGIDS
jgi:hypothetical protein